jgi:organic hydroperoxide reductase OsmC/OhrA
MPHHTAIVSWKDSGPDFLQGRYARDHTWAFDGGLTIPASSSPHVVKPPYVNPASLDPEEALVASIASCHMLTFLFLASRAGFKVESYRDEAVGTMTKNEKGVPWVSTVILQPAIVYSGERRPTAAEAAHLQHEAHEQCFIANSVKTEIRVQASG